MSTCARVQQTCGSARGTTAAGRCSQTADPRARLSELLEQREPLYREAAHIVVRDRHAERTPPWLAGCRERETCRRRIDESTPCSSTVELGERSYPIHIGRGLLDAHDLYAPHVAAPTRRAS